MRIKILILALVFFLVLPMINVAAEEANLGTFASGTCIKLIQTCGNCTYTNLTSVNLPNSSSITINNVMTKSGTEFTYNFCNTTSFGTYIVNGVSDVDGFSTVWAYNFEVNGTGVSLSLANGILFIAVWAIAVLLFGLFMFGAFAIPYGNNTNAMTGYVIAIDNKKYIKLLCFAFAYLTLMLIMYFSYIISFSFLYIDFLTGLFKFAFYSMAWLCVIIFPIMIFILIANVIRDSKLKDMLIGGLKVRE